MKKTIAVIAAHPDDEVLGCGGSLALFAKEGHPVHILFIADGVSSRMESIEHLLHQGIFTSRYSSSEEACRVLGCTSVEFLSLPDNRLDGIVLLNIIKKIENFIEHYSPNIVITHHAGDVNIDHRIVHEAVLAACRPLPRHPVKELLFFEVPSSTEWRPPGSSQMFNPNVFIDISQTLAMKMKALHIYESEIREFPHPRSYKAVDALALWRGASAGVEAAEAFILGRKLIQFRFDENI